ncbi:MAG: nucleotidyltransferase family protein [Tenuifilaceae bacterium]
MDIHNQTSLFSTLNPEQRVLVSVCSLAGSSNHNSCEKWLKENFSWNKLIILLERHRLIPIFYHNLKDLSNKFSVDIPSQLTEKFIIQTQNVLKLTAEGLRVSELVTKEGIPLILLKGPFLSERLYSNPGLRPSRDIDILTTPENIDRLNDLLINVGYKKAYPDFELSAKQKQFYQKHKNQYAYRNLKNGCLVELHWRLFSSEDILPVSTETLFAESVELVIAGKTVKVLSNQHSFQHLCLHGSIHQWFRLHWLRDIAQFVSKEGLDFEMSIKDAKINGTERAVEQAIRLSNLFFDGSTLNNLSKPKSVISSLVTQATSAIINDESKTLSRKLNRLRIPFYKMKIRNGVGYKLSCWTILQPNFDDWKTFKFPDNLFFLYFLLRPFLWFYRVYINKK